MKTKTTMMLALLALGTSALLVSAQDNNNDGPNGGNDRHGPGMRGQRPPPPAIFRALDANHDGVIDADEIANASAVLKTLDKNGDGKITLQEAMGPRPPMRGGQDKRGPRNGAGGDDNNLPPGPPPGAADDGHNPPAGPPPSDN